MPIKISEATKHYAIGAVGGMVALLMIVYSYKIMLTPAEAERLGKTRSEAAVAQALAPFCAERFRADNAAPTKLVELKKLDQYQQATYIEKGGWATTPGGTTAISGVAAACGEMLTKAK
jgi:hypothetical protein